MIGIFGGTFDPPHIAHLEIAHYLLNNIPLEKIIVIPCYLPALKHSPHTSPIHRLAMLKIAMGDNLLLEIDDREIQRKNLSYTIDTIKSIRKDIGNSTPLAFIMGSDAFNQFLHWKDWQDILKQSHLIVINRQGHAVTEDSTIKKLLVKHQVKMSKELFETTSGKILICPFPPMDISSTTLREELSKDQANAKDKLPKGVWEYIMKHGLYKNS